MTDYRGAEIRITSRQPLKKKFSVGELWPEEEL